MQHLLRTLKANLLIRETWLCVLVLTVVSLVISLIIHFSFTTFCDALTVLSVLCIVLSFKNGFRNTSFADREKGMLTISRWMLHAVADKQEVDSEEEDDGDVRSNAMLSSGLICLAFSVAAALLFYA